MNLTILYEDADLIVCVKPVGVASQDEKGFQPALTDLIKQHLVKQSGKKGEPYLGIIHRLDKPVGGVMVYAKTKKAAASLSKQVSSHEMKKHYYAILSKVPDKVSSVLTDYLVQDKKNNCSFVVEASHPEAKKAELSYQILERRSFHGDELALADVLLITGRHHQIRVQFSHLGCPLYGDTKYSNSAKYNPVFEQTFSSFPKQRGNSDIALYSYCLEFIHPCSGKVMRFSYAPSGGMWEIMRTFSSPVI